MRRPLFFPRLAVQNITRNRRFYLPYLLTCAGCAAMFYILLLLSADPALAAMYGGGTLQSMLVFGVVVIGVFSLILIFYTNSFLMKRRRRELGLWNILGLEKRHIARVLFLETLFIAAVSILGGLLCGMLLSKLLSLLLYRLVGIAAPFGMLFSLSSCAITAAVFGVIFLLTLAFNLLQIHLARPVELLRSGKAGERQPRTRWLLTLIGLAAMTAGYVLALRVQDALAAINTFFLAVLLVIVGTYCLFTSGSIAALKALRRNRRYYYQTRHFTAVSGMLHRMKQNAAGLASICILCTMILVTVSTTVSLYSGLEDVVRTQYPHELTAYVSGSTQARDAALAAVRAAAAKIDAQAEIRSYRLHERYFSRAGNEFSDPTGFNPQKTHVLFIPWSDYAPGAGGGTLADGEALLWSPQGTPRGTVVFAGTRFAARAAADFPLRSGRADPLEETIYAVLTDADFETFFRGSDRDAMEVDIDTAVSAEQARALRDAVDAAIQANGDVSTVTHADGTTDTVCVSSYSVDSRTEGRAEYQANYGGFLFLGIFLGTLFLMATVLIIYYKQVSEGYDDRERFVIMQQVGMSRDEVRSSIRSQVLTVFFLPIGVALLHVCGAFRMMTKLMLLFNLSNVGLFVLCTALTAAVFAVIYGAVYALTARTYYKIVS